MRIAGYCRISVDEELDRDNTSIMNQRAIITEFVSAHFPQSSLDFYEDRDKSGYTFAQRDGYQKLRRLLIINEYDILIVKDFSRFSRRNSKGLSELEDLRDYGVRIISITDNVDYPKNDDWLSIQFRFLMNEMPVTDTSKKVRKIIENRQRAGEWICNAPYGYYLNPNKKNQLLIDEYGANTVALIFSLYNKGDGYKKIASYLTRHGYKTPLTLMAEQLERYDRDATKLKNRASDRWSPVSVAKIIQNDFYIGTLRQHVWTRRGINKADVRVPKNEQHVHLNHHPPIIDEQTFALAQKGYEKRTKTHYRGVRKYPNIYSGFLFCEDCGSPMFSISNPNRPAGYICSSYHKNGVAACSSHHIRESVVNAAVSVYIGVVCDKFKDKIVMLDVKKTKQEAADAIKLQQSHQVKIEELKLELKAVNRQRIQRLMKNPDDEDLINESFDGMESDLLSEIKSLSTCCEYLSNEHAKKLEIKKNLTSIIGIFDRMLQLESYTKDELSLIIERILVDSDKVITVVLKSDISELIAV